MNGLETPMQPPPAYCKANPIYITLFVNTWTCSLKYQNFFDTRLVFGFAFSPIYLLKLAVK